MVHMQGLWRMHCWNGLDREQQDRLVRVGNLPWGFVPRGTCHNGATVEVFTWWDIAPGPRFYCARCAALYILEVSDVDIEALRTEAQADRLRMLRAQAAGHVYQPGTGGACTECGGYPTAHPHAYVPSDNTQAWSGGVCDVCHAAPEAWCHSGPDQPT